MVQNPDALIDQSVICFTLDRYWNHSSLISDMAFNSSLFDPTDKHKHTFTSPSETNLHNQILLGQYNKGGYIVFLFVSQPQCVSQSYKLANGKKC